MNYDEKNIWTYYKFDISGGRKEVAVKAGKFEKLNSDLVIKRIRFYGDRIMLKSVVEVTDISSYYINSNKSTPELIESIERIDNIESKIEQAVILAGGYWQENLSTYISSRGSLHIEYGEKDDSKNRGARLLISPAMQEPDIFDKIEKWRSRNWVDSVCSYRHETGDGRLNPPTDANNLEAYVILFSKEQTPKDIIESHIKELGKKSRKVRKNKRM